MNHDVPQPTTATRSPAAGRPGEFESLAAWIQQSGWLAISALTWVIAVPFRARVPFAQMRALRCSFARHSAWTGAADATVSPCSRSHALCLAAFRALMCTVLSRNVHGVSRVDRYARWNALLEILAESGRV